MTQAVLILEDGTCFYGYSFGKKKISYGEVVFNTCMTGYQEVLTDPSYCGQMVCMTYPLIGNYGFTESFNESIKPNVEGFIVKEFCYHPSNWQTETTSLDFFNKHNLQGIYGVDTRQITRHIRKHGSMYGAITTNVLNIDETLSQLKEQSKKKRHLVSEVTCQAPYTIEGKGKHVVVMDFGVKQNILRSLSSLGLKLTIVPASTSAKDIRSLNPDGLLLSNGPGDPIDCPDAMHTIQSLIEVYPMLAICLGHQLLGSALGGKTYKLKFGHHGGNHPVKDLIKNRVYITSQNHNYALDDSFSSDVEITHINLNDQTIEGFRHKKYPIISVQYHPEAAPGPLDSNYIFTEFYNLIHS